MKNAIVALATLALACVAGCGGSSGCLTAVPANATTCPAQAFIDATANDPVCLTSSGVPQCRGNDAICYRCTGASFSDGCLIKNAQQTIECVHSCNNC